MTNRRLPLVLLLIFVVLGVLTISQGNAPVEAPTPTPTATLSATATAIPEVKRLFPDWRPSDIMALRLENPETGHTFTLRRNTNDQWAAAESATPLNQEVVNALLEAATQLSYKDTINQVSQENLAEYGLTREAATLFVQVVLANQEAHFIVLGTLIPDSTGVYALVDELEDVFIIERTGGAADVLLYYFNETIKPTPTR